MTKSCKQAIVSEEDTPQHVALSHSAGSENSKHTHRGRHHNKHAHGDLQQADAKSPIIIKKNKKYPRIKAPVIGANEILVRFHARLNKTEKSKFQLVKKSEHAKQQQQFADAQQAPSHTSCFVNDDAAEKQHTLTQVVQVGDHVVATLAAPVTLSYDNLLDKLRNAFPLYKQQIKQGSLLCRIKLAKPLVAEDAEKKNFRAKTVVFQAVQSEQELASAIEQVQAALLEKKKQKNTQKVPRKLTVKLILTSATGTEQEVAAKEQQQQQQQQEKQKRRRPRVQHSKNSSSDEQVAAKKKYDWKRHTKKNDEQEELQVQQQEKKVENCEAQEEWPQGITKLYLDGNNMFFMTSTLRNLVLKKMKKGSAEAVLKEIALRFHKCMNLQYTNLCFDRSKDSVSAAQQGFEVSSAAAMKYKIADDALVAMAEQVDTNERVKCLFVTSDRELRNRLTEVGVRLGKPKQWLKFACKQIKGNDCTLEQWIDEIAQL